MAMMEGRIMNTELGIQGYTDGDIDTNGSSNPSLREMVDTRYSRRQTLFGGMSATALAVFGSTMLSACGGDDENGGPTVSAGQNATTNSGRVVTLAGTASDSDGINGVAWTQTGGPMVTLTGAGTNTATFLAPSVSADTELKFTFTATDKNGKPARRSPSSPPHSASPPCRRAWPMS
jgi:hypothetical protein